MSEQHSRISSVVNEWCATNSSSSTIYGNKQYCDELSNTSQYHSLSCYRGSTAFFCYNRCHIFNVQIRNVLNQPKRLDWARFNVPADTV